MPEYTPYTTKEGDRWDTIAWSAYGDTSKVKELTEANPFVPLDPILPGGLELRIPILTQSAIDQSLLPPWKR